MEWWRTHPRLRIGVIILAVIVLGFGAFATWRYIRVRAMRKQMRGEVSLRHILDLYDDCWQYGQKHGGDFPPSLDALVPEYAQASDLKSPLNPRDPEGYLYTPGFRYPPDPGTGNSIVIEDKFGPSVMHERIMIHADGEWGKQLTR
jgi:hypothetical protein